MSLADRIKEAMQVAGLSGADLARATRVGLWADRDPVPPWEWRAKK